MNYIIIDEKAIFGTNYCFGWWKSFLQKIFSDVEFTFFSTIMYKSHSILNFIQFFYIFFYIDKAGDFYLYLLCVQGAIPIDDEEDVDEDTNDDLVDPWGVVFKPLKERYIFLNCACEELMYLIIYNIAQITLVIITCNIVT